MKNKLLHHVLLGCAFALTLGVAYISLWGIPTTSVVEVALENSFDESYLAAINASYSSRQPHTHSLFSPRSSQGTRDWPPAQATSTTSTQTTTSTAVPTSTTTQASQPVAAPTQTTTSQSATTQTTQTTQTAPVTQTTQTSQTSPVVQTTSTATVTSTTTTTVTSTAPNPIKGRVGVSVGATLSWLSSADLNTELNMLQALGITWIRYDFEWDQIQQKGKTTFDWAVTDKVVKAVLAHNMKLLPVVAYSPTWARSSACAGDYMCAPQNPADYAAFAAAAAARYAPQGIHQWEIWNEPNISGFWKPAPSVEQYSALLKAAYKAIKAVDPTAKVISGGLAPAATVAGRSFSPIDFLKGMYAQGDGAYFDALGFHPYSFPALPSYSASWNAWQQMANTSTSLRSTMAANGDANKQIWMTEYGAPTGGPGVLALSGVGNFAGAPDHVTSDLQAQMLSDALTILPKDFPNDGPLFWYSYKDLGTSATSNENFFGFLNYDGSPKPSYTKLKQLLQ